MDEVPLYGLSTRPPPSNPIASDPPSDTGVPRAKEIAPPLGSSWALGIGLLQGARGGRFLMSEVPLYATGVPRLQ